jgi:hypothetical protein
MRGTENLILFCQNTHQLLFRTNQVNTSVGDWSGEGPPGPIPNPEVKLVSADGTWGAAPWESRSLPTGFYGSSIC